MSAPTDHLPDGTSLESGRGAARSTRRAVALLIAAALGVLLSFVLSGGGTANATPPYPPGNQCVVSSSTSNPTSGQAFTVVGSGFKPHQRATLSVSSATLGSAVTNADGSFTSSVTWPSSVSAQNAVVQASSAGSTCSFPVHRHRGVEGVQAHRSTASGSSGSSSGLSSTGFAVLTATTIAVVLIGAGALFLGLARRKSV